MLTAIIFAIIFTIIAIYIVEEIEEIFAAPIIGFFVGFFIGIMIPSNTEITLKKTYYLVNMQDNSNVEGSFFLGSGTVDEELKYTFYYKSGESYKLKQIPADLAKIKYLKGDNKPRIEVRGKEKTDDFINHFSINTIDDNNYTIFVPEGSIKNNYKLDAK